jgi:vacuolar-type H+-ATPase subunit I/STV1
MRPIARKLLTVEYVAVRTPLALLDGTLRKRLSEDSPVRRAVAVPIAALDGLAGRLLAEPADAGSGSFRDTQGAESDVPAAVPEEQEQIAEALIEEVEEQRRVVGEELIELDEDEQIAQAELMAKHRAQELEEERRLKEQQERDAASS